MKDSLETRETSKVDSLLNIIYRKTRLLSDISKSEQRGADSPQRLHLQSKERCIWRAGRHDWAKVVWMTARVSFVVLASGSERGADYRVVVATENHSEMGLFRVFGTIESRKTLDSSGDSATESPDAKNGHSGS